MQKFFLPLSALVFLSACANTPIAQVGFPPPTVLSGNIHSFTDDGFILKDASGQIEVDTEGSGMVKQKLTIGEMVTVKGVLDEDDSEGKNYVVAKEFDAYSIIRKSGEEIKLIPYDSTDHSKQ